MRPILLPLAILSLAPLTILTGCEDKKPSAATPASSKANDHGHSHGPGEKHDESHADHGGPVIALGDQTIGPFSTNATRDQGQIVAGKDTPVDVTVTPSTGSAGAKAVAVRLWIGAESAKGSIKAKAEIENAKEPNRWHVHVEIPNPMPAGSKLWVEIEDDKGGTHVGGFDLKM